jgi:FSR family fosmidomycin resistance protein-like MFS transporter
MPGKVGMIAGIFFGLMFGVSGIGAAAMGISPTSRHRLRVQLCSYLPLLGILTVLLPHVEQQRR